LKRLGRILPSRRPSGDAGFGRTLLVFVACPVGRFGRVARFVACPVGSVVSLVSSAVRSVGSVVSLFFVAGSAFRVARLSVR
jgi:hypothetical protein